MKFGSLTFYLIVLTTLIGCSITDGPGTFNEISKVYSPDSSKILLTYEYQQGAWDGGRTTFTAIVKNKGSIKDSIKNSFSSLDFDNIYWKGDDTVILEEKFTEFVSEGKSKFDKPVFPLNDVYVKVIQNDPIDSSYSRKIIYRETSPDNKQELIAYRYIKPVNGNYFLNISVINENDSLPKYGNFFISKYDFDCIGDIRWKKANQLSIKAADGCYYAFSDYLVKNRPPIEYILLLDETGKGNIINSNQ